MCPQERPDAILPTMGGQTGLNLAKALSEVRTQSSCPSVGLRSAACMDCCTHGRMLCAHESHV